MNALTPIGDKIAILIPRLASDKDGEVVATVRAIGRQLQKSGSDWHDLASRLTIPVHVDTPETSFSGVRFYREAVMWILDNGNGAIGEKEFDFLINLRASLSRRAPTAKQAKWLGDILERCGGYWS